MQAWTLPMINYLFTDPLFFIIWAMALLTAITIHEFAHAFAADKLGDPTPRIDGRLTLNPLAHLDPLGTLMMLLIRFGWGKPVVFDPYNLKNPTRDAAVISFAGPLSNLLLSGVLAIIYHLTPGSLIMRELIPPFIILNVTLAIFNLVPIHPLDGGKILVGLLPKKESYKVDIFLKQYGTWMLLLLILPIWGGSSPILSIIEPAIKTVITLFLPGYFQTI
ncbi:MAG: site-2 protease family protein [Patescibacteria group bacterium]